MPQMHGFRVGATAWSWPRPASKILIGARAEPP